ncbi:MAG: hypothetical protein ACM3X7_00900 [Solirubrobacterales bacterium]
MSIIIIVGWYSIKSKQPSVVNVNFNLLDNNIQNKLREYVNKNGYYIYQFKENNTYKLLIYTNEKSQGPISYTSPKFYLEEKNNDLVINLKNEYASSDEECTQEALVIVTLKQKPINIQFFSDGKKVEYSIINSN